MPLDHERAKTLLSGTFAQAEAHFATRDILQADPAFMTACEVVFHSSTQSYREVLLGCVLARIQDHNIDVRKPYVNQGTDAFNGRTLDERVVNPFLQSKRVPCSRSPYLATFRRSVQFVPEIRQSQRDRAGYDAFLAAISVLEAETRDQALQTMLGFMLYKFVELREASNIALSTLQRVSLDQYDALITGLLATPSQGRFPVVLLVATFRAISGYFEQGWTVDVQGINQPDGPSGAGGDITIKKDDKTLLVAEVTERPVDIARVVATFQTKIAPNQIEDYLFFIRPSGASLEARRQAHQYFAQGHEVNFLEIKPWILMALATMGRRGRQLFNQFALELLGANDIPRTLKVAWNTQIEGLVAPTS